MIPLNEDLAVKALAALAQKAGGGAASDYDPLDVTQYTLDEMKASIAQLGWIPRRRNVFYELFEEEPVAAVPAAPSWAVMLPVATAVS